MSSFRAETGGSNGKWRAPQCEREATLLLKWSFLSRSRKQPWQAAEKWGCQSYNHKEVKVAHNRNELGEDPVSR